MTGMKDTKLRIIDSSVVFKWFVEEDVSSTKKARELLAEFEEGKITVLFPDLILYELSNILAYKKVLSDIETQEILKLFCLLPIKIYTPTSEFISKALEFARKYQVTVYDASYAVLAKEKKGIFITADKVFVNQVKESFVELL